MAALLRSLFVPETEYMPKGEGRDRVLTYWVFLRDANPFAFTRR